MRGNHESDSLFQCRKLFEGGIDLLKMSEIIPE